MDTHMVIRSIIFLVASLTLIAVPKGVLKTQSRVVTYLAEKFHTKDPYSATRLDQRHEITVLIVTGFVSLIISAILFVVAMD